MDWQTIQIVIVLALTVAVFASFVRETWPADVVAMLAFSILLITGILSSKQAMAVFSNSGPITVGCMFVLSAALERTGLIERIGGYTAGAAGKSPVVALVAMALVVMVLSAFINNTPVVVVLTPVAFMLARALKISPSRLLIPLSYAAIMGGTTTLIGTSTNLLVNGIITSKNMAPISMFEITGAGVIMGLAGIVYLATIGRWLLPDRVTPGIQRPERAFVTEVLVPATSPFNGKTLSEAGLTSERGVEVIDVIRNGFSRRYSKDHIRLEANDRLVVRSQMADVMGLRESERLVFGAREEHQVEPIESVEATVMEGVVGPQSRLIGYKISDLNFRRMFDVYILAIYRQGTELRENFDNIELQSGDTLLLEGPAPGLRRLFDRRLMVNLTQPSERPFRRDKAPIAVGAIAVVMALATFNVLPIEALAIAAATLVIATGCLTAEEAYTAIEWRVLMLIFGMLGLGLALENTGAAELIVRASTTLVEGLGPVAVLALVYVLTSALTEIVSNNATAVLLTPIAIGLAQELGVDPRPFAMAVLFAASASFATPIGYQTNTFVYGVGGYKFSDFVKIGLPMNVINAVVAILVIPIFWPLK
jgi:di/tricarboxylate transporter